MKCKSRFDHNSPGTILILILGMMFTSANVEAQEFDRVKQELFQPIESALQQARDEAVPTFAPTLFAKANQYCRQAEQDFQKGERLSEIREQLEQAMESLNKAVEVANVSKVALAKIHETRKQVAEFEFIRNLAPKKFAQAERDFREAILKAEDGNIKSARQKAESAQKSYREATVEALEKGPIKQAEAQLKQSKKTLPREKYIRAKDELAALKTTINKAKKQELEISSFTEMVFEKISFTVDGVPIPCLLPIQPKILDVSISAPEPGDLYSRSPIYYVTGNKLDVILSIPNCTQISKVLFDGFELGKDFDPIEGGSRYYTILSDVLEGNTHRVTIRLHFANLGKGVSTSVKFTVKSEIGMLTTQYEFTLVMVKDVNNATATFTISETEIRNNFIVSIYEQFGDDGSYDPESGFTLYNPSYENLDLRIENDGVHFGWQVKAAIEDWCNPTITASGRFHLEQDGTGIRVIWDEGPDADIDFALYCDAPASLLGPTYALVMALYQDSVEDKVRSRIQERIDILQAAFGVDVMFINTIETRTDELQVVLNLPLPSVTIEVPYGTNRLNEHEPWNYGMALNSGEQVVVIGRGLTTVCGKDGYGTNSCNIKSGPAGLFNTPPIPSPWEGLVYEKQRHDAWKALQYLPRDGTRLPMPPKNVAALVAKLGNGATDSQPKLVGSPCFITARNEGEDRLVFGANDYSDSGDEKGNGTWQITVGWPPVRIDNHCCPEPEPPSVEPPEPIELPKRITVTFEKVKVVDNAYPPFIQFFFGVNGMYRGFPQSGPREFSQGEWVNLQPEEYSFSIEMDELMDNLHLDIHTTLPGIIHTIPMEPFVVGPERLLRVTRDYPDSDNFGNGTHTEVSNKISGYFEVIYSIKMESIPFFELK